MEDAQSASFRQCGCVACSCVRVCVHIRERLRCSSASVLFCWSLHLDHSRCDGTSAHGPPNYQSRRQMSQGHTLTHGVRRAPCGAGPRTVAPRTPYALSCCVRASPTGSHTPRSVTNAFLTTPERKLYDSSDVCIETGVVGKFFCSECKFRLQQIALD